MNILFLVPRFYPDIGGVEKHSYEIAKRLARKNKVTVLTEGRKDRKENLKGIKVIRLYFGKNDWFKKFLIWKKILDNRKLVEKADIIHCHDVFFWYLPLRLIYPRKKVYITFHGYETVFPVKISAIFIRKLSEKLSNGNIIVGEYINKWYGTKPDFVTYGGIDKARNSRIKKFGKKLRILFIGRMDEDMGVKIYSGTLKQLKNYEFEACGDGSLRSYFEEFGEINGFVKNLTKYILNSDIIFASSYLTILESLNLKKPVFSVFSNPLKEDYLKDASFSKWIYTAKSSKILLGKIELLRKNKKTREKNQEFAYNWVKEQTWDKLTASYLKLWNKKL